MTSTSSDDPRLLPPAEQSPASAKPRPGFWLLTLGSIGVVFGDIGTSPLYAMREALAHAQGLRPEEAAMGVVSLVFWA